MLYDNLIKQIQNRIPESVEYAQLKELPNKYYRTQIDVFDNSGNNIDSFFIVSSIDTEPSDRELEKEGISRKQWDNNEKIINAFGNIKPVKKADLFEYSHMETQFDYLLALHIVNLINNRNKKQTVSKHDIINLGDFIDSEYLNRVHTLYGNSLGETTLYESNLENRIKSSNKVTIVIPEEIYSVNPSFLEALIRPIVKELGKQGFENKVNFKTLNNYNIDQDLNESIDRIIKENE